MKIMKSVFLILIISLILISCKKNSEQVLAIETCDVVIKNGRLKNPYSISENPGIKAKATHVYEKIILHSIEEYDFLIKKGVNISIVPFENISEKESIEKSNIYPVVYAVVPVTVDLSGFQHIHLDDLFMPEFSDKKIYGLTSNTIQGTIHFKDPISGVTVPVGGVKVIVKDVTKQASAITNQDGGFEFADLNLVSDTVQVLIEFSTDYYEIRTLDAGNLQSIVFPNKFSLGYKRTCGLTNMQIEIGQEYSNSSLQYSMATLLALNQYKEFATAQQLLFPTKKMVFWLGKDAPISTSYSAPMLNHIALSDQSQIEGLLTHLFGISNALTPILYLFVKDKLPDIYAPYYTRNVNLVPKSFMETLYHEYTHASHYAKVGNNFWNIYIQHIFQNGGYGDGTEPDAGMIELSEAWAEDVSYFCAYQLYGLQRYISETEKLYNDFIPYGIYNDIYDNSPDTATINGNIRYFDQVSGISFTNMYQLLTPAIRSPQQFRQELKSNYPAQATAIDSLFSVYGF